MEVFYTFLISTVDGSEWSASRFGRFTSGKEASATILFDPGWAAKRAGRCEEEEVSFAPACNLTHFVYRPTPSLGSVSTEPSCV
jgi:hypothetical protein